MLGVAACTNDVTEDIAVAVPETLTVSFEENSRVQLQNDKTVWTAGDQVSVFYRSNANQKWEFQGETGDTYGTLKRVSSGNSPTIGFDKVVVVYPYTYNNLIEALTGNIQSYLPATQNYAQDSYGIGSSIMISSSRTNNIYMKNVCGWLKLQLTGNEVVKYIKLKGNNGEQVAGTLFINSDDATCMLATEMNGAYGDGSGDLDGTLIEPNDIFTEVNLDCGDGVALSAEPTTFYIALPPQTFEKGVTVEIFAKDGTNMTKSTSNPIAIERNTIQPMESVKFEGELDSNRVIIYTSSDGKIVTPYDTSVFGANCISNVYDTEKGYGTIAFDNYITSIGDYAFYKCKKLTSVTISDSVISIGKSAFYNCSSLASVTIPNNVTSIGSSAFEGCISIASVTIGNGVTSIGRSAFYGCMGELIVNCNIPSASSNIYGAFYESEFTKVTIGDSVTSIGNHAFDCCRSLTSITIPDSVTSIGHATFAACSSLTNITIPNSVTFIDDYAFYDCTSLTNVAIGNGVTLIGYNTFGNCSSLKGVYISDLSAWCKIDFGYDGNPLCYGAKLYLNNTEVTELTIPSDITNIKSCTFSGYKSLTSVTIPDSVTSIESGAFQGCSSLAEFNGKYASADKRCLVIDGVLHLFAPAGLTEYTIPDSVTSIGGSAFRGCSSLTSVTIPDSVTSIGSSAFSGCSSLTSVTIPDSVTSIGNCAFGYCNNLASVTIGTGLTSIGELPFDGCSSLAEFNSKFASEDKRCLVIDGVLRLFAPAGLTEYTIPDGVTSIGNLAFFRCSSLTSITIPDRLTSIRESAFFECSSLTSVTIPDSVTSIGGAAFYGCSSLTEVYCKPSTPPAGYFAMFNSYGYSSYKIYVPRESVDAYKAAEYWNEYADYIVAYDFE